MDGAGEQLALFDSTMVPAAPPDGRRGTQRGGYVPRYEVTDQIRQTNALLDRLLAQREGLKRYEGCCQGCGKVISIKAPHCNRRWCKAVWKSWSRDQRRVVREALKAASQVVILTDVTLSWRGADEGGACPWPAELPALGGQGDKAGRC
jgi:hypothetical protein